MTVSVLVKIRGIAPLLQNAFEPDFENEDATRTTLVQRGTPKEQAEARCYRDSENFLFFPGAAIARMVREAGANHKLKGSRRSVKWVVPSSVIVDSEIIHILDEKGKRCKEFEVDRRPVTIPATKGRIMRYRPRWDKWRAAFVLSIEEDMLPVDLVQQLVEEGGRRIGVGDYRPEKGGPFGRFALDSWETIK